MHYYCLLCCLLDGFIMIDCVCLPTMCGIIGFNVKLSFCLLCFWVGVVVAVHVAAVFALLSFGWRLCRCFCSAVVCVLLLCFDLFFTVLFFLPLLLYVYYYCIHSTKRRIITTLYHARTFPLILPKQRRYLVPLVGRYGTITNSLYQPPLFDSSFLRFFRCMYEWYQYVHTW